MLWLFRLVRVVWETGVVPKDWIDAMAVPLFKGKGNPSENAIIIAALCNCLCLVKYMHEF